MKSQLFTASAFLAFALLAREATAADLPPPWQHQDIGPVTVPGAARATDGVFTLQGTLDIWGATDGCHFAWQKLNGDVTIVARVLSVENTQGHAKGGLAIRQSLAADSKQASMVDTPADGTQFLSREEAGGKTMSQKTALNKGVMPYWVKLVRQGDKFTGYESTDGREWTQTGTATIKMADEIYIGLVASSHVKDKLCEAAFDNVSIGKDSK
jgi:regulation of enolase protein 1 (concanavalin A-like superfamily)